MDTAQWPQEMVMKPMEAIIPKPCNSNPLERKVRPQKDEALNCPRCNSTNTKFCYYNNYNLSQPRYFCKTCRRYWTEGGTLRNIPVGGGSRKHKRSSSSVASSTNSSIVANNKMDNNPQDLTILPPPIMSQNPNKIHEGQDLNLGFPPEHDFKSFTELIQAPNFDNHRHYNSKENLSSSTSSSSHQLSAMELLTGITPSSRGFNSFIPIMSSQVGDQNNVYSSSSGFSMPLELKPSLDFSLYGLGTNNNSGFGGGLQNVHHQDNGNERFLFPFEDLNLKEATTTNSNATTDDHHQHVQQSKGKNANTNHENSSGYWNNGVLGGGTW